MNLSETVAAEVRAHLARQRRSASGVARQLGWSQVYLSRRLTGQVQFGVEDLAAIAAVLGVPVTVFFEAPAGVRRPGYPSWQALAVAA